MTEAVLFSLHKISNSHKIKVRLNKYTDMIKITS